MKFENIMTAEDMRLYLDDKIRLRDCKYLSHYTNYEKLIKILRTEKFYLSKAEWMNDQLEFQNGSENIWNRLYFFSLIMSRKENIGMWSVYSQPWGDGIKLSFSTEDVKTWLSSLDKAYIVDEEDKVTDEILKIDDKMKCFLSAVAYTNTDSKDNRDEEDKVTWNTVKNTHILSASRLPELTGYIKDTAWAYEQEIRIKVLFQKPVAYHRIALDVKSLMPKMIITTGPLFEGSLQQRLQENVVGFDELQYHFGQSIFQNRFRV